MSKIEYTVTLLNSDFGDHNEDKNEEYVLPIEPKIIKKELVLTPDV